MLTIVANLYVNRKRKNNGFLANTIFYDDFGGMHMKIKSEYYDEIFKAFERKCGSWAERAVEVKPKHEHAIRVTLDNGDKVDYNFNTDTFRYINGDDNCVRSREINDLDCRSIFSRNLMDRMKTKGFGQASLAERTGLSSAIISKYLNKKSTPTITNVIRIADALDCEVEELLY